MYLFRCQCFFAIYHVPLLCHGSFSLISNCWVIWPCSIRDSFPLGPFRTILTFNIIHEIDQIAHDKESVQFFRFKDSPYKICRSKPISYSYFSKTTEFMVWKYGLLGDWLVSHVRKWKYVLSSYFEINEFLRMSLIRMRRLALPFMVE